MSDLQGTVIHGTMRPEDLIPAFLSELTERIDEAVLLPGADEPIKVNAVGAAQAMMGEIERRIDSDGYYEGEESSWDLEWLFDALNDYAPEGLYFGAIEGDGSDYGFWEAVTDD